MMFCLRNTARLRYHKRNESVMQGAGYMTSNKKIESRQCFLDVLRVVATCAVVLLHTVTGIMDTTDMNQFPAEKTVFLVALDWITWCVPIFVLISGFLFLNPNRKISFKQMLGKYCRRILLALVLFGVPYAFLEQIAVERTFRAEMLWNSVLLVLQGKSWSHMWYLYLVLFLYLITPALKAVLPKMPRWLLLAVLAFLFIGSSILPFLKKLFDLQEMPVLPDAGIYLFYYICGYLFVVYGERNVRLLRSELIVVILLLAGMTASRLLGTYSVQMAYNYPFTVVLALLLMHIAITHGGFGYKKAALWESAGKLCFAVYLIHPVFVNVFYKFLHITPLTFHIGLSLPILFAAILLMSALGAWILRKIPLLEKYVL